MKSKNFNKKLILNKKTIATLNRIEMKDVNGGFDPILTVNCSVDCTAICSMIMCNTLGHICLLLTAFPYNCPLTEQN